MEQTDHGSDLYWRIILDRDGQSTHPVCMQWFDEYDYDQTRFVSAVRYPSQVRALIDAEEYNNDRQRLIRDRREYLHQLAMHDGEPRFIDHPVY